MISKSIKQPLTMSALVAIAGIGTLGITSGIVSAHSSNDSEFTSSLSEKLNVDEAEVQTAMDELKEERQAEREAEYSEELQSLVDSGEITEDQKAAIETKREEMEAERESRQAELETWSEENGIDLSYLRLSGGRGGPGGGMRMR